MNGLLEHIEWFISAVLLPIGYMLWKGYKSTQNAQWRKHDEHDARFDDHMTKEEIKSLIKHKVKESELKTKVKILEHLQGKSRVESDQD